MLKFIAGTALGAVLSFIFVQFNLAPPAILKLPERVKGDLVSAATEAQLYDMTAAADVRERALKVYFDNRSTDAAKLDASLGHPFLNAMYKVRAQREARQLLGKWSAFEKVLSQPALREALVRKHGTDKDDQLKTMLLVEAFGKMPFLEAWLKGMSLDTTPGNLLSTLRQVSSTSGDTATVSSESASAVD